MAGATMMVVGSKLAGPLILQLQVDHPVDVNLGGTVKREVLRKFDPAPNAERHVIAGFSRKQGKVPRAPVVGARVAEDEGTIGGYAISYVPKDFWDKWAAENKDFDPLKRGFIVAHEKLDFVEGVAKDKVDVMSGMEPFNPAKPSAEFARITSADAY